LALCVGPTSPAETRRGFASFATAAALAAGLRAVVRRLFKAGMTLVFSRNRATP